MENENNTPPCSNNSIVAGISSLIVLIVIIVMVTSLLNNKSISDIETRTEKLEANVQSLLSDSTQHLSPTVDNLASSDNVADEVLPEVEISTVLPDETTEKMLEIASKLDSIELTSKNQDSKIIKLETKLRTTTSEISLFTSKLNQQANSLQVTLKQETKNLAKLQNDKFKTLETQLQSITKDMVNMQRDGKQLNSIISQVKNVDVTEQVKNHDSTIEILTVKIQGLADEINNKNQQIKQLEQKIDAQISQLKTTLEADVATQLQNQNAKITALETQLQMLIGGLSIGQ